MSKDIIAPKGRLSFPALTIGPAERIERLKAELRAMGMHYERAAETARYYERLARARSPMARQAAQEAAERFEARVRAGEDIPAREAFKHWYGTCRAMLRDFPGMHFTRLNHSRFDVTFHREDGLYRPLFAWNKYFRIHPEGVSTYYRDFEQACRASGKRFKRLELDALRTMRRNTCLTARFPK